MNDCVLFTLYRRCRLECFCFPHLTEQASSVARVQFLRYVSDNVGVSHLLTDPPRHSARRRTIPGGRRVRVHRR